MQLVSTCNLLLAATASEQDGHSNCPESPATRVNWEVMMCVLTGINLLKIAIIHDGDIRRSNDYLDAIISELYLRFNVPLTIQTFPIDYEDESYTYADRFSNEGEFFELRPEQRKMSTKQIYLEDDVITNPDLMRNNEGRHFGWIVVVPKLEYLDGYLHGISRYPFKTPSALYFIHVLELDGTDGGKWKMFESISERIWRFYGILKAVITFRCGGSIFYYFNPFEKKFPEMDGDGLQKFSNWGRTIRANLSDSPQMYCKRTLAKLYTSFNQYPLRYRHFSEYPFSYARETQPKWFQKRRITTDARKYSKAYEGSEGIIFGNLMGKLQFDPVHRPDNSNAKFGYWGHNSTWTGDFGELLYRRSAFAANRHWIANKIKSLEYMRPIESDRICVASGNPPLIPRSTAVFRCFRLSTWFLVFAVQFIAFFYLVCIRYYYAQQLSSRRLLLLLLCDTIKDFADDSSPRSRRTSQRFLLAASLIFTLTIGGIIEGYIAMFYTSTRHYQGLQTLQDVYNSPHPIVINGLSKFKFYKNSKNAFPLSELLREKIQLGHGTDVDLAMRVAEERNVFTCQPISFFQIFEETHNTNEKTSLLHVVPECLAAVHVSYLIRKDWPLTPRFNEILSWLDAAGLLRYWEESSRNALTSVTKISKMKTESNEKALTLDDFKFAFLILAIGNFISFCVFCCERRWH